MIPTILFAAILCDPCSRAYPVGCTGSDCSNLSDTPTISCAAVARADVFEENIRGVVLKWRAADETAWHTSEPIPAVDVVDQNGETFTYFSGLTFFGPYAPGETRRYRTTTLPLHRYLDLPAGELFHIAILAYNENGSVDPPETQCVGEPCEPCGYFELCWYSIWNLPGDPPEVECW